MITPETSNDVFEKMEDNKYDLVLFGLTDNAYKNISVNLIKIRNYIIEQNSIIRAYQNYYEQEELNQEQKD